VGGYAFGDSAPAARRLGLLADFLAPASHPFLARFAGRQPGLAVDLGCGTGHTTRLLASVLAATWTPPPPCSPPAARPWRSARPCTASPTHPA
jgi:hypothetical protein